MKLKNTTYMYFIFTLELHLTPSGHRRGEFCKVGGVYTRSHK